MLTATSGLLLFASWVVHAASEVPERFPPGPWLTDVRIQGPEADWPGLIPRDPDLPDLRPKDSRDSVIAGRQCAYAARSALSHPLPEWWQSVPLVRPFLPVPSADATRLEEDATALRMWFMSHGFLDCTVSLELSPDDSAWGRWLERRAPGQTRRATYVVSTGERWSVSAVDIDGLQMVDPPLRRQLREAVEVTTGAYDGEARARTEAVFRTVLSSSGFPFPNVTSVLVPDAERGSLSVLFHIAPGQRGDFGEVAVAGLTALDRERVRAKLAPKVTPGERWDSTRLDDLDAALDGIPSFAKVEVVPGEMDENGRVPVQVSVTEAELGGWAPRAEFSSDPTFYAAEVGASYRHNAVGRQLATFESRTLVGYRVFPVNFVPDAFWGNHGPTARQLLTSDVYVRPVTGLSFSLEGRGELEAVRAANLVTISTMGGLRVRPLAGLELGLMPELAHWRSFAWTGQEELWSRWFVEPGAPSLPPMSGLHRPAFRPSARGAMVHLKLNWKRIDQPILPTKGSLLSIDLVPFGAADGDVFLRAEMSAVSFISLGTPRLVLVPRVEGGVLRYRDPMAPAVAQLRFQMGGGASLRGWGVHQANPPGWDGGPSDFRIGGNVSALGSLELRWALWPRLHLFGFGDVGRTWESLVDRVDPISGAVEPGADLATLLPSTGAGVALPTPLGRAALSAAVRLREETELLHPPPMATVHLTLVPKL